MDDKNAQELNALEEAAFNDPVKFLNEQHAPRTWTMSTEDLAKTAAVSPYEIMATSEERWGPEKASVATTAVREFVRGFAGMADSTVNGIMEDRAKEIIYRSPNMRQQDANRLIEDVMRSGSLARQVENYESSKTAHDNFTAGISNGLGSMVSLALLGWATRSPAVVGAAAGIGEAYSAREEMVDRYIQEMGTAEGLADQLGKYNALSTGYGVFAGFVEGSIGVERLAAGALNRYGRLAAMERLARQQGRFGRALAYKTGRRVVTTGLEEGGEEFLQSIGQDVAVALTRDMWENPDIKKALIQAGYGAIIGSTSGGVMYNIGRKRAIDFIRRWNDENNAGLTESQMVQAADAALDDVAQPMVDEIATRAELRNQYGQAYEVLKNRFRQQIESTGTTPWTDQNKSMEEYIDTLASTLSVPAVLQANGLNIPTAQFLEIADMVVQDNVLQLVPLNNAAELEDIIARQTNVLAQQREAKKLGMGDDTARQTAERRKAIAQKALRNLREEERIRKQIVQEKRKADKKRLGYDEIDQAKKDTKFLKNARTLDSFKAKLEDGTTTEQAKNRLEAAFMNWIADKDKTLAEDLILYRGGMQKAVDLLTANAQVIYDTAKKHPGARLREDIANALRKLRHTNKDNFLLVTQALARDGHDVMPENILLWHWVFADPTTNNQFLTNYTTKLAENREQVADGQALFGQKVAPLSKKDLIMQALQDTDQAKAQLAESRGRKYEPLFDKNGAVKEPYLAAAIVSYQNQFAPRFAQQMPRLFQEQFDLADENARLDEIYPEYSGKTIVVDGKRRTVYNSEGKRINKSAEALRNFWRWFGDSKVVDKKGRPLVVYHGARGNGNITVFDPQKGQNVEAVYFSKDINVAGHWSVKHAPKTFESAEKIKERISKITDIDELLTIHNRYDYDTLKVVEDKRNKGTFWLEGIYSIELLGEKAGDNIYVNKFGQKTDLAELLRKKIEQAIPDALESDLYSVYMKLENPLIIDAGGKPYWQIDFRGEKVNTESIARFAKENGFDGLIVNNVLETDYENKLTDDYIAFEPTQIKSVENLGYYNAQDPRMLYQTNVYDGLTTTNSVMSVTNILQQLKDGSHERLLFDTRNNNWYLADANKMVHADMFVRAFRQGNYPEFNNEREAEQYFQENYLSDDPTLLQFLATKNDSPADTKQAMEHTLGTDEYTHAYLRDGLVVFARGESDLRDSGFPVERFDHYKAEYDENNNRQIVLVEQPTQGDGRSLGADYRWQPINPRSVIPRVRGGWTKEKILRYLKSWGSYFGAVKAVKEISNFDSVEDFKNHVFYHGARYGTSGSMSPSITMSDREVERISGGGYGEKYWAISVTKSKRVAGNFATAMDDGRIYPVLLAKNAKVIEMPELTDSADLEDHIVDLYNQGVDAVWIGDKNAGEQELAVINPRAIINIGKADFYRAFRLGSEENPIRMKTDKDFETIFEFAKDYRNKDEETRVQEARDVVYWQGRRATVRAVYDPELQTVILGKNWNELSLVHEFHHHYLKKIWDYFKQAQAGMRTVSKAWLDDTQRLFSMLEIDPNQKALTTVQQEKFAYMVEAYLTGLGVENQDNLAFQGFLHWIPEKYRSIMDLGYLDANGQIQNPMLDEESIAFFNKWFASPLVPSLPSAPDAQRIMNASDEDGEIIPSNQKVMNNREKEWGQDSEIQNKADAQLWRGIGENTPSDMRAALDGEKELMKVETNNMPDDRRLPVATKPTLREKWFKTRQPDARETAAEAARAYLAKNPEHARELAFADPETLAEFDAPVDQGMLIRAVMETVNKGSDEWYVLDNNLAMVKSMSGSTLSLSGDLSHQAYLDAKREIEMARELKAITNYAGTGRGAAEKWNGDIRAFAARRTAAILATEPNSEERKAAIEAFLEEAKTKFSGNTTNAVLNQLDLTGYQTKSSQVFIKWAEKQIKNVSHARLDAKEQAELMKASVAAQLALQDIDSKELKDGKYVRAVQSSKDIRHWQFVKDKMKKAYIGRWGKFGIFWDNLWGSYAPSAMLMSVNTLFFANVPSTAINTGTIRLAALSIGENKVDKAVQKGEIKRIKQIFNASGMNIAQMDKPTSPSLLHGEKYTQQEQKHWYNFTFDILGREDNVFRVPTFVDALARIATKNANGDPKKATALFNEYTKLNTTDDEAKIARKQALAVANMAVFTQDGIMASALNHIRSSLNTMTRGALGLEPGGFGLGNILAPFLKTGANITEMGLSAALALPRTAIAIAQNKLLGKEIPDVRRIALISDWINLAWTAVVIAVLAAISGDDDDWYTEPYESGKRYDPYKPYDSVRFGNTWVKLDIFGPMAIPLRTALKVVKDWEKKKLAAVADGLAFGGMEALSDTPLVNQFMDNQVDYMTKQPGAYWSSFGYNQLNKLVPAQAKTLTKAGSRATGIEWDTPWMGKAIDRKFHRNYGLDGERLTTNDLLNILTNKVKVKND